MKQLTLRELTMKKNLRVQTFLDEMNAVIPWDKLISLLKPYYYSGERGRPPHPLTLMLRIHFLQLWHNLSDPAMEEALYDRISFYQFAGLDGFTQPPPDETAICRFRHFLEEHELAQRVFDVVNEVLASKGLVLKEGTIVDATLFEAPVSKKNANKQRDPEMSSTKKNNQWHFGSKGHIGIQANGFSLIHSIQYGTAKEHDIKQFQSLLHGQEQAVFGDSGYMKKQTKQFFRGQGVYWGIHDRGASRHPLSPSQKKRNTKHARLRAKVEHPFRVMKVLWNQAKLRYKGLKKNASRFTMLCALCNLYMSRKALLA